MTVPPATCLPVATVAAATRRVLVIGGMGFIGQFVVAASLTAGHPTYVLLRGEPSDPTKASLVRSFRKKGATILHVSPMFPHLLFLNCFTTLEIYYFDLSFFLSKLF